ncbi:MAG: XTP/dITP diphosphatase [Oscillospiraceae bacterium]
MEFIAASNNEGKLKELARILTAMGHTVKSQKEIGITIEPIENGATFEENALIKARTICAECHLPTIADDSGLVVDALQGEPGIYSARYCGHHGDDEANNDKLLYNMQNVPCDKRTARFVSVIAVVLPNGEYITATGVCEGSVGYERRGTNGFGYDPIFNIAEYDNRSYSQLTNSEKDKISHRGKALANLAKMLPQFIK